tara:strand:+ start:217 stop:384 length:168 start_codon:yes stop_codon:yes gene_type:complete
MLEVVEVQEFQDKVIQVHLLEVVVMVVEVEAEQDPLVLLIQDQVQMEELVVMEEM